MSSNFTLGGVQCKVSLIYLYLFVLAFKLLSIAVGNNSDIREYPIKGTGEFISFYVDDTVLA